MTSEDKIAVSPLAEKRTRLQRQRKWLCYLGERANVQIPGEPDTNIIISCATRLRQNFWRFSTYSYGRLFSQRDRNTNLTAPDGAFDRSLFSSRFHSCLIRLLNTWRKSKSIGHYCRKVKARFRLKSPSLFYFFFNGSRNFPVIFLNLRLTPLTLNRNSNAEPTLMRLTYRVPAFSGRRAYSALLRHRKWISARVFVVFFFLNNQWTKPGFVFSVYFRVGS